MKKVMFFLFFSLSLQEAYSEETLDSKKIPVIQKSKLTNDQSEDLADHRFLLLSSGEDKAVDLNFDANTEANGISYGNPQIVTVNLVKIGEKRQLIFKPVKSGETTVTIRDNDGTIRLIFKVRVTNTNLITIKNELNNLLRDVEGLDIRIVGSKVIIGGEVIVPSDYATLLTVIQDKNYADLVLNMATLSPLAMQVLSKKIQEDIASFTPDIKTRVVNGMIFLEGTVEDEAIAKRANNIALLYLPDLRPGNPLERDTTAQRLAQRSLIQSLIVVKPAPPKKEDKLLRITINFVELSKDYNKLFGFQWQPGFTADPQISVGSSGSSGASFTATISSLLPKLYHSQTTGFARVLKTGTIIVKNRQPAKLVEQTEFPFATTGPNGQMGSSSKAVGLTVGVTPSIIGKTEDIDLDLKLDQTELVGKAPAGSAPVTASHKVDTTIIVKSNESAAIGGVIDNSIGTDFNKDPPSTGSFSQGTDPLFNLLHSKAFRKQKSQFVIFVTPQIIENASEGTDDLKKNFRIKVN